MCQYSIVILIVVYVVLVVLGVVLYSSINAVICTAGVSTTITELFGGGTSIFGDW